MVRKIGLITGVVLALTASATADDLRIYPQSISLNSIDEFHRVIVVSVDENRVTHDVTEKAILTAVDPTIVKIVANRVFPMAAGETSLTIEFNDRRDEIPVSVKNLTPTPTNFKLDVVPVFTKAGCNAGTCHGASRGQDGFRLSLFGFDPKGDYFRVTREMGTRRINLAVPERSLLLQKATGEVTHTGGKRFELDSDDYHTLHRWLAEGAHDAAEDTPAVTDLTINPAEVVLRGANKKHRFVVTAQLSDGSVRDVTDLALFNSTDPAVAEVDAQGELTTKSRGESFITCRFDVRTVGATAIVLPQTDNYVPQHESGNYIDDLIAEKLEKLRYHPSPLCSDADFLRRATIDLNGRLPTLGELADFENNRSPTKRTELAAALITRPEFDDLWTAYWADLFVVSPSRQIESKPAFLYQRWLRDQVTRGEPIDKIVHCLLTAKGSTFENPETNFYAAEANRNKIAENVAQACLGIRTQCAKCHNHPFDRWTMDDYYGFAAFFQRIGRKREEDYREWIIFRSGAELRHPVSNAVVQPKFLGGVAADAQQRDRLELIADWITAPDNPYFAKNIANRVWAHFFGRGIVEPVDDVRISNPPSNLNLYECLATRLVEYDFDIRKLSLDIVGSHAYQRSTEHPMDAVIERDFGRAAYRRIPANVLLDCISQVTESHESFRGLQPGEPAVKIPIQATNNYFLRSFGQSGRKSVCACESKTEPTLSQALHLLNGATTNGKIKAGKVIPNQLADGKETAAIIENLYLRCLARWPTEDEHESLTSLVEEAPTPQEGLEDVFWALLNSREFVFNH